MKPMMKPGDALIVVEGSNERLFRVTDFKRVPTDLYETFELSATLVLDHVEQFGDEQSKRRFCKRLMDQIARDIQAAKRMKPPRRRRPTAT